MQTGKRDFAKNPVEHGKLKSDIRMAFDVNRLENIDRDRDKREDFSGYVCSCKRSL